MGAAQNKSSVSGRVRDYRRRMRAKGMRPVQLWVADVRAPGFAEEARLQSMAVAAGCDAADDQRFIDALSLDET